jgi:tRNA threonylcarbamoyladenosine biosynthesis protein TsaE
MIIADRIAESEESTLQIAADFAVKMRMGDVLALVGPLGAGKTVFTKGLCGALECKDLVSSPSYTLVNIYEGRYKIYHVDLYRIEKPDEIADLDPDKLFYPDGITIIEWAEKVKHLLPKDIWIIKIDIVGEDKRRLQIARGQWPH